MECNVNLKEIERNAYRSTFQDGLWDIFLGLLLMGMGISPLFDQIGIGKPWKFLIFPFAAWIILFAGKRYITIPRLGFVEFGPKRKADQKKMKIILSIFMVITVLTLILTITQSFSSTIQMSQYVLPIVISLFFMVIPLWVLAYYIDFQRLYIIAILFGLCWPLTEWITNYVNSPYDGIVTFGLAGGIIMIMGLVIFFRFLHRYPNQIEEPIK